MKKIIFLLATPLFMMACNNSKTEDTSIKDAASTAVNKEERNKQVITACMDNFAKGDLDATLKDVAPQFKDYGDGSMQEPITNVDTLKNMFRMIMNSLEGYKAENTTYYTDGDYVLVQADWVGTFNKDLMGIKHTGRPVRFKDIDIFKLNEDGKVVEHRSIQNVGAVLITESMMKK